MQASNLEDRIRQPSPSQNHARRSAGKAPMGHQSRLPRNRRSSRRKKFAQRGPITPPCGVPRCRSHQAPIYRADTHRNRDGTSVPPSVPAESQRLAIIPGVGVIRATALAASVTDPAQFRSSLEFAASVGLVRRQNSSGCKGRLGRISKIGDRYLGKLLVFGATSVIDR